MIRTSNPSRSFWLTLLAVTFVVNMFALRASLLRWNELGVDLFRSVWGIVFAVYLGMSAGSLLLFILIVRSGGLNVQIRPLEPDHPIVRALGWMIFLAALFLIPYIKFTFQIGRGDKNPFTDAALLRTVYYWLSWYVLLFAMLALKLALKTTWPVARPHPSC